METQPLCSDRILPRRRADGVYREAALRPPVSHRSSDRRRPGQHGAGVRHPCCSGLRSAGQSSTQLLKDGKTSTLTIKSPCRSSPSLASRTRKFCARTATWEEPLFSQIPAWGSWEWPRSLGCWPTTSQGNEWCLLTTPSSGATPSPPSSSCCGKLGRKRLVSCSWRNF